MGKFVLLGKKKLRRRSLVAMWMNSFIYISDIGRTKGFCSREEGQKRNRQACVLIK
jgi:hypothetical protein